MTKIRIGHPAYTGANRAKYVSSKAAALRELRARGVLRDDARDVIRLVCSKPCGYQTIRCRSDIIEVFHDTREDV